MNDNHKNNTDIDALQYLTILRNLTNHLQVHKIGFVHYRISMV